MRKFVLFAIIIALLASMTATVQAAPPPDGPPGLQRAIEAQEAHTDRLLNIPDVVGTAQGEYNGEPCLKVFAAKKNPELLEQIPQLLGGYRVIVEETGEFRALGK